MLIVVTVKCMTVIKLLFLYFNLCLSVRLSSLSCAFTSIYFLTNNSEFDMKNNNKGAI
jgi:hypothetical protein